nr:hypothetical protein [uncultured Sellimonas sp.]
MLIAKNDEKERSHLFRIVIWTASIVIIVIAAYFLIKIFVENPVSGKWQYQDDNITMTVEKENLELCFENLEDAQNVTVKMNYDIDKTEKILVINQPNEEEFNRVLKEHEGKLSDTVLQTAISKFTTSFDYSIEKQKMTLTDREYGEQMTFDKK